LATFHTHQARVVDSVRAWERERERERESQSQSQSQFI
jgi:hypothetical protein